MAEFTQTRKKEDLIAMVKELIKTSNGNDMMLYALNVDQGNGSNLYTTSTNVLLINTIIERLPRTFEHPDGIQRALKSKNVDDIREGQLRSPIYDTPNSITILLRENCDYYSVAEMPTMNGMICLTIHLKKLLDYLESSKATIDSDGYLEKPENASIGYMIDGHHRNEGAYLAAQEDHDKYLYEFPTSIYIGRDRRDMPGIFGGINNKQQKPSSVHTMAIRMMSNDLDEEESQNANIMEKLNTEADSVLKNRVKVYDGRLPKGMKPTFVTNSKLVNLISDWWKDASHNPASQRPKNEDDRYKFLNTYLSAFKDTFPEAWDNTSFVLTKSMGFDLMFAVCNIITTDVVNYTHKNRLPTKTEYVELLNKIFYDEDKKGHQKEPVKITFDGVNYIPFDWSSANFGSFSNGKGVARLKQVLKNLITERYDAISEE